MTAEEKKKLLADLQAIKNKISVIRRDNERLEEATGDINRQLSEMRAIIRREPVE
jgi:hypothetical protein